MALPFLLAATPGFAHVLPGLAPLRPHRALLVMARGPLMAAYLVLLGLRAIPPNPGKEQQGLVPWVHGAPCLAVGG